MSRAGLPTVLIVDDEPLNRDLLRRVLFREFDVREAHDAESALATLEAHGPVDILVCDQVMPGRTGCALAREVRARHPRTVTLLLTGYEDAPEVGAARRDGVIFEVVGKPWAVGKLKEAMARVMAAVRR